MKFKDLVSRLADHVDRLMREGERETPQLFVPERSMARPRSEPESEPVEYAMPRPWATGGQVHSPGPPSRLRQLRRRLRRPESLREAIILKEIFDRPLARRRRR